MDQVTPVYDEAYYRDYDGQRYERNDVWATMFRHVAGRIDRTLRPERTLDAGCAIGLLVEALVDLGIDAHGFDLSEFAVAQAPEPIRDRMWVQGLTEPIKERYDLVTCIEVIEHLPESEAFDAVSNLCSATDTVLLSSTPEEHEEPTHLNVQPPEYWSALFAANDFFRDTDYDASFISPWAVLYRRRPSELTEVVRSYDRAFWRQRDENQRLRQALLQETERRGLLASLLSDDEWDEARASGDGDAGLPSVVERIRHEREGSLPRPKEEELRERIVQAERRALMLKDELMGATARSGELAARLELMQGDFASQGNLRQRYVELEARHRAVVNSTTWRLAWKVMAPYRRLRGRS
jgi:cyclopropane fatty-acyl-phospholipid synthase-like methyltransferase